MLSSKSTNTATPEPHRSASPVPLPRLCSIKRACLEWGDCGTTRFYEIAREYKVRLLKIGSKTVVTGDDVNSVADKIIAEARQATIDAKALASRSVAARRARRGSTSGQPTSAPSPPATTRRRRRGSTT